MAGSPNGPGTASRAGYGTFGTGPANLTELQMKAYGGNAVPGVTGVPGQDGMVYMGKGYERPGRPARGSAPAIASDTGYRPIEVAALDYYGWGPEEHAAFNEYQMATDGYVRGIGSAVGHYENLLQGLAQYQAQTGQKTDPWEFMLYQASVNPYNKKKPGGGGGGGSSVRSIVNLTNPQDAEVLLDNALAQYLGRQANDQEIRAFVKALNKSERANPVIATTGGQRGGMNPDLMAQEFATSRKNYAETQASTTYMGWMMDALMKDPTEGIQSGL